jgi:hypothetical protein
MRLHTDEYVAEISKRVDAIQLARRYECVEVSEMLARFVVADERKMESSASCTGRLTSPTVYEIADHGADRHSATGLQNALFDERQQSRLIEQVHHVLCADGGTRARQLEDVFDRREKVIVRERRH